MLAPPRVAFVVPANAVGGAERYLANLLEGLSGLIDAVVITPKLSGPVQYFRSRGFEVVAAAISEPGWGLSTGDDPLHTAGRLVRERRTAPGVRSAHSLARLISTGRNRPAIARALSEIRPDVIHVTNGGYPGASAALATVLTGSHMALPTAMTVHSLPTERTILGVFERRLDRAIADSAEVIGVTDAVSRTLCERRNFEPSSIRTIRTGVPDPGPGPWAAPSGHGPVVGMLADFRSGKLHEVVVDAFTRLLAEGHTARLVLAGDGPRRTTVERYAAERGILDATSFTGTVRAADFFSTVDIVVLASLAEGLPLAVLEALSYGKPVVASAVGGVADAVVDGVNGFLIHDNDPRSFAAALAQLAGSPALRETQGCAARQSFLQGFTFDRMVSEYAELFAELRRG